MKRMLVCLMIMLGLHSTYGQDRIGKIGPILFISFKVQSQGSPVSRKLFSMDEDGTNIKQINVDSSKHVWDAKWLPDGKQIVIATDSVLIIDANGNNAHYLHCFAKNIVLSPDGKKLAFDKWFGGHREPPFDVVRMNLDGSDEQILYLDYVNDWSPDGTTLIGSTINYDKDSAGRPVEHDIITFFDQNGKMKRTWGQAGNSLQHPIYSTRGDRIAFISTKGGNWLGIYVMTADGKADSVLTPKQYKFNQPVAWSPDDEKLLYNAGPAGINMYGKILVIDIHSKQVKDITPFNSDSSYSFAVGWKKK